VPRKPKEPGKYERLWLEEVRSYVLYRLAWLIYWEYIHKLTRYVSRQGSVTLNTGLGGRAYKGGRIPPQLMGDAVIEFLRRHNIPHSVDKVWRGGKVRKITVHDIPALKQIAAEQRWEEVVAELEDIIEALYTRYRSPRGADSS
jgi:hypothetical protein